MKNINQMAKYSLLCLISLILSFNANALAPDAKPIKTNKKSFLSKLVDQSNLIFKGQLISINEGLSIEEIPYTFVTYRISEIIAGNYAENEITLKFVGGQFPNGNRLSATNSPNVTLNEKAILMVQQEKNTGCDFVECEHGRFVIENENVIAANETAIIIDDNSGVDFITLSARESGKFQSVLAQSNVNNFISHLRYLSTQSLQSQALKSVHVTSADPLEPFNAIPSLTAAMRGARVPKSSPKNNPILGNPHDQWEEAQLRLNGGNPVLNDSYPAKQ